ncbi:MAG: hypothetical protein PF569_08125 [Candidatus Woesearchaeota archaeon]|jgi:hypothetical protein|nr:hypothetical protein [Candidatus Woesearchaeota archaeon]
MDVFDLPIYREYFETFLKIFKELENLKQNNSPHKKLIENAYNHAIIIFPNLNAGYNYWSMKGKLEIYIKVRISLSQLQIELSILRDLDIVKTDYSQTINSSIKYMNGLIRKLEHPEGNNKNNGQK